MTIPTATYRIQFRNGMTFDRATVLVPYLKRLGISHLYASPIFTATTGSTHGYDVTYAGEIDPAIGGRPGFDRLVEALKVAGLGLILDIVPNHMAASLENPWWRDVIENGKSSAFARHFDVDWSRRLTLPFLGGTFDEVLQAGEISVRPDPKTGRPALAYFENFYPLNPDTYAGRERNTVATTDKTAIAELHDRQPYRLMSWRDAPRELSYRRFFEITGLVGVRVEDKQVFDETHRLILDLVRSGAVDGLRIDHIDGLADPKAYLDRLRHEAGPNCYIVVEKILGAGEHIPTDWPISGTTGYEFIDALGDVLVDGQKLNGLRDAYQTTIGETIDMQAELRAAKLLMADNNFAGEVATLLNLAMEISRIEDNKLKPDAVGSALRELLIAFPVYRTYGTSEGLPAEDRQMLAKVLGRVRDAATAPDPDALALLERVLVGNVDGSASVNASLFRRRFQQLTGPLMAKSVEDTLFFRQTMALALNEVGAEPLPRSFSLGYFHDAMRNRLERQPNALSATSTHDTKRGEDARARLYVITEAPKLWSGAVTRWREMNKAAVQRLEDGLAPEPAVEWMIYQALAGVWPTDLRQQDAASLKALEQRFIPYVEKALREAKLRTNWGDANELYEKAVIGYARSLLSPENQRFLTDFTDTLHPLIRAGLVNGMTQTIVKLTAPGVPDIYQGSEALDLSLVDPDNRREPDFEALQNSLAEHLGRGPASEMEWLSGRLKHRVIAALLGFRGETPRLFQRGDYLPLSASGEHSDNIVAFARVDGDRALIAVAPRLVLNLVAGGPISALAERWQDTRIVLPPPLTGRQYRDMITGRIIEPSDHIAIAQIVVDQPFAVLSAER